MNSLLPLAHISYPNFRLLVIDQGKFTLKQEQFDWCRWISGVRSNHDEETRVQGNSKLWRL